MTPEALRTQYTHLRDRASRFAAALQHQLLTLIEANSITLAVPLEGRVKNWDSIEEKMSRKSLRLDSILDLDDLIGVRVIVLFRRDLVGTDHLIRNTLQVEQSEDTSERLAESQFGYQSLHYVARFPAGWLSIPTFHEFSDLRAEIQIRTVAQHIWAASSHKLQYKHEQSVPEPLRRSIYRVSALLETVDLEFDRLLAERESYVEQQASSSSKDDVLNVDILGSVLTELLPAQNKKEPEDYADLLVDLQHFDVSTEDALRAMLAKHMAAVLREDARDAGKRGRTHYYRHVGLARNALRLEVGDDAVSALRDEKKQRSSRGVTRHP